MVSIGHGVGEVAETIAEQAKEVCSAYGQFISQPQIDLAEKIAGMTPKDMNRVFFVSGGSEATESAMKIARKYHVETGHPSKYKVISCWQSWHGYTVGALSRRLAPVRRDRFIWISWAWPVRAPRMLRRPIWKWSPKFRSGNRGDGAHGVRPGVGFIPPSNRSRCTVVSGTISFVPGSPAPSILMEFSGYTGGVVRFL